MELHKELQPSLLAGTLYQAIFSSPKIKGEQIANKVVMRPIQLKEGLFYQFESYYTNKVLHQNIAAAEAIETLISLIQEKFKQILIKEKSTQLYILSNKKGQLSIKRKHNEEQVPEQTIKPHNRQKRRVLEEGTPITFLVELGIMTAEGRVHAKKQDKFRQINRFLEMVEDVLEYLPTDRTLKIVDFGCGKSYLTFALYHYLTVQQQRNIEIIGLDLKSDVIQLCNDLAERLDYKSLSFLVGDIAQYEGLSEVDMVVTLHACDTATDAAIGKAVNWGASVIMSVPCCQHELFPQVSNDILTPLLSQGLLKERFASLATDAIRGQLLESIGYRVQMLEFIDPEHTPKNLLIRAVRPEVLTFNEQKWDEYVQFKQFIAAQHTLEGVLKSHLPSKN
ncbi:MAG TPA: SAM-dependent methyltransferase [Candidatus Paenibacillus intestinavium]|nr:SAM-dependent methyltransferase [Candidatus Paenibacillus intestinavium]